MGERVYMSLGRINDVGVYHVISEMGSGGVGGSQQTVDLAIRALKPLAVIAVGIAFGVSDTKQQIGDILVSTQLQLYELQRVGPTSTIARGDKPSASPWLINVFRTAAFLDWSGARVHLGLLLSGEKLIDNVNLRTQLIALAPEAIGGEMEGAGLYVSSTEHRVPWIVVKAICDWGVHKGEDKDARQRLAAKNAAEFVVFAISKGLKAPSTASAASRVERHDGVAAAFDELAECFHTHSSMMASYRHAMINKMRFSGDSLERMRADLDHRVFAALPKTLSHMPPPMSRLARRLREIMSTPLQDPLEMYYLLQQAKKEFPRRPIEAAAELHSDLYESFAEMLFLRNQGTLESSAHVDVLRKHNLDEDLRTTRPGAVYAVAYEVIIRQRLSGIDDILDEWVNSDN